MSNVESLRNSNEMMMETKKKILILADFEGWAYDHKATALKKCLTQFNVEKRFYHEFTAAARSNSSELNQYDAAIFLGFFYYHAEGAERQQKISPEGSSISLNLSFGSDSSLPKWPVGPLSKNELPKIVATLTSWQFLHSNFNEAPALSRLYARSGAVSKTLYQKLIEWGAKDPVLCMNGVEEDLFVPLNKATRPNGKLRVGWVGSIRNKESGHTIDFKGFDAVLRPVMRELLGLDIEFKVHRINSMDPSSIKSQEEMVEFYNDIDVYLSTSHKYSEGTPNPAFEASSCGVPVVSTVNGCIEELISPGENGFIAKGWETDEEATVSAKEICGFLQRISDSDDLLLRMKSAARREIESNWTWQKKSLGYVRLLDGVLSDKNK